MVYIAICYYTGRYDRTNTLSRGTDNRGGKAAGAGYGTALRRKGLAVAIHYNTSKAEAQAVLAEVIAGAALAWFYTRIWRMWLTRKP